MDHEDTHNQMPHLEDEHLANTNELAQERRDAMSRIAYDFTTFVLFSADDCIEYVENQSLPPPLEDIPPTPEDDQTTASNVLSQEPRVIGPLAVMDFPSLYPSLIDQFLSDTNIHSHVEVDVRQFPSRANDDDDEQDSENPVDYNQMPPLEDISQD